MWPGTRKSLIGLLFKIRTYVRLREEKTMKGKDEIHVTPDNHTGVMVKVNSRQEREVGNLR